MVRFNRLYISVVFVSLILGLLLSTSFYTWQRSRQSIPATRKKELIELIRELERKKRKQKSELEDLRTAIGQYEKGAAAAEGVLASFNKELEWLKFAAGLTEVKGEGLQVILGDSPQIPLGKDPNNYIIHDYDIRAVVNALWAGRAEAIAINNQRLVATSAIRCAGNTILVNSTRLAGPYRIKAVGNPKKLKTSLNGNKEASRVINNYAKMYGLVVKIERAKELKLPAYKGSIRINYAQALK